MRPLAPLLALGLIAGCAPVVVLEAQSPTIPVTDRASEDAALAAGLSPGEGLPGRGAPACAPPGTSAGIEPPCDETA